MEPLPAHPGVPRAPGPSAARHRPPPHGRSRGAGARGRISRHRPPNTNAPAIHAYRALGFEVGAIDLFYYSNEGADTGRPDAEVAVFMKLKL